MGDEYAITYKQAKRLEAEAKFERFYAEHNERRTGPTPEELGAEEARRLLDLERIYQAPAADR